MSGLYQFLDSDLNYDRAAIMAEAYRWARFERDLSLMAGKPKAWKTVVKTAVQRAWMLARDDRELARELRHRENVARQCDLLSADIADCVRQIQTQVHPLADMRRAA
jgi:hypothetical protein